MNVTAIRTPRITVRSHTLEALLEVCVPTVAEGSVLAVTSKVVSLCEGDVVPVEGTDKMALMRAQAEKYADLPRNEYGLLFTIAHNTLIPNAGVDASNAPDVYVLWPSDIQAVTNRIRRYIQGRFGLKNIGVIITDSTVRPLRWGAGGISLAHSGFKALRDYRGEQDLFGRIFQFETADIVGGLAAAAVLTMGEGDEQMPMALITDVPFVVFQDHNPTADELAALRISPHNDLYSEFFAGVSWQDGGRKAPPV